VFVMRAMRPSRPSNRTANASALAAIAKCGFVARSPDLASSAPSKVCRIAMKPRKIFALVKRVGRA
jgi:hypothetical protein